MLKIYPFKALIPDSENAAEVACPPYDVLSLEQARGIAENSPKSFVKVIRPEIDPAIENYHAPVAYQAAKTNLESVVNSGDLVAQEPAIYLYRQSIDDHSQTGVVCCYDVEQYREGLIKKHEKTRPDKEDDRVRHMLACSAHPEPVLLTFPSDNTIDSMIEVDCHTLPIFDFAADDGVQHTGWRVQDPEAYVQAFSNVQAGYIADGHHRTAAADRTAQQCEQANDEHNGSEEYNRVMSVFFPVSELRILAYNRHVKLPPGLTVQAMLEKFKSIGELSDVQQSSPSRSGEVCFYCEGKWQTLIFPSYLKTNSDLIDSLDAAILQDHVLNTVFGIDDPRTNPNIGFVGGSLGTKVLEQIVDAGDASIAFSMFPTSIEELIAVSDQGEVMPPKSTWFDPKLRSGLFVHPFDC